MGKNTYGFFNNLWKTVAGGTAHQSLEGSELSTAKLPLDLNAHLYFLNAHTKDLKNAYFVRLAEEIGALKQANSSDVDVQFLGTLCKLNAQYKGHYLEIGRHVSEMTGMPYDEQLLLSAAEEPQRWLDNALQEINRPEGASHPFYHIILENLRKAATPRNIAIGTIVVAVSLSGCLTGSAPTALAPGASTYTDDHLINMPPEEFYKIISSSSDASTYCDVYALRKKADPKNNGITEMDALCSRETSASNQQNPLSGGEEASLRNQAPFDQLAHLKGAGMKPISKIYGYEPPANSNDKKVKKENTGFKDVYVAADKDAMIFFFEYPDGILAEQNNNPEINNILLDIQLGGNGEPKDWSLVGKTYVVSVKDEPGKKGLSLDAYELRDPTKAGTESVYGTLVQRIDARKVNIKAQKNLLVLRVEDLNKRLNDGTYQQGAIMQRKGALDLKKTRIPAAKRELFEKYIKSASLAERTALEVYAENEGRTDAIDSTVFFPDEVFVIK